MTGPKEPLTGKVAAGQILVRIDQDLDLWVDLETDTNHRRVF